MPINQVDETLRNSVLRAIDWEPAVLSQDINVKVKEGIVTLTGFAHSFLEKMAAERAAKSVYGVLAIANDIAVKPTGVLSDPEIAREVERALKNHPFVPDDRIKVMVREGHVFLEGSVEWNYQRSNAEAAVWSVQAVRNVTNDIRIKPSVSASEVKQKIEDALRRNAEVDARHIQVSAHNSKVELYGFVRSWLEREEAVRAAWAAPGVSGVTDNMTIAP
jgi:osmotically-inducible protein OsmY